MVSSGAMYTLSGFQLYIVAEVNGVYSVKVHIVFSSSALTVHLHLTAPSKELHLLLLYPCHSFSDARAPKLLLC